MTKEEQNLLLKDLCARLPYGVVLIDDNGDKIPLDYKGTITNKRFTEVLSDSIEEYGIKPYLRPMSSMTEEEKDELAVVCGIDYIDDKIVDFGEFLCEGSPINIKNIYGLLDWLNAHHFDYRGLIEKGLAFEAPEGMYN